MITEEGILFLSFCEKKAGFPSLYQNTRMKSQILSEILKPAVTKPHITHGELHLLLPLGTTDIAKSFADHNSFHIIFSVPAEKSDLLWEVSIILLELSATSLMACKKPAVKTDLLNIKVYIYDKEYPKKTPQSATNWNCLPCLALLV